MLLGAAAAYRSTLELAPHMASACRYSSREAQQADWAAGHKHECKAIQMWRTHAQDKRVPETFVRLVLRALWRRSQELARKKKGEAVPFWESYDSIAALVHHKDGVGIQAEFNVGNRHVAQKVVYVALRDSGTVLLRFDAPKTAQMTHSYMYSCITWGACLTMMEHHNLASPSYDR